MNWESSNDRQGPIIQSLLDTDFYKFTMGQVVFHHYPQTQVRYSLKNRTKGAALSELIKEEDFRNALDSARNLKFNASEIRYLRGATIGIKPMFSHEYLYFLENQLRLPPYELSYEDDGIRLEVEGDWAHAIYWEIPFLSVINELRSRAILSRLSPLEIDNFYAQGISRLSKKVKILKEKPGIVFIDFGTRRRFSGRWQDYVVGSLARELSSTQFRGTSNVLLAMKHGLWPMGTSAHEMFMVAAGALDDGSDESVRASYQEVMSRWYQHYGYELSIALTDTYGSPYHFRNMTKQEAHDWKGLRQDSGDPFWFTKMAIEAYQKHGIDPREKMIIFSDGLEVETIQGLFIRFGKLIKVSFGWGTNLTNDLGIPALSLVVKPVMANGRGLVKLSDNPAKAVGKPDDIERYKRVFGYEEKEYIECKY